MASNFVGRDEFDRRLSNITGYVDHSIDQLKTTFVAELRATESRLDARIQEQAKASESRLLQTIDAAEQRMQEKMDAAERRTQEKIDALRDRHDVEIAQVHTEFAQIREVLMWMAQRLPPEPIGPPPAQFLRYDDSEKA